MFDWKTPIWDGVLQTPHTAEVPFIFGTMAAAAGLLGTGTDLAALSRTMIATWSAFAHSGDPNNPALPHWPRHDGTARATMMLDTECQVLDDPGGVARAALDAVPMYEYGMKVDYPQP